MSGVATAPVRVPGPEGPTLDPGWHHDVPMGEYLALRAMSASGIELFRRSPLHFEWRTHQPSTTSPALEKGTALHLALLEPEIFPLQVVRGIGGDGRTKAVRDARAALDAEFPEATVLTPSDFEDVIGMRDAVLAHPRARSILAGGGASEVTGVWIDPETGVPCKMRPDRLVDRAPLMPDVKTTRDASPDSFRRQAANLGYFRKARWYRRGAESLGMDLTASAFIAVENTAPYGVAVYLLREEDLADADQEITRLLNRFAMCATEDHWPGYGDEFQTLSMPSWARHSMEENDDE
ncbi:hypothetical protein BH23CHL8_BH23CHL8_30860 [soil metagenome]